MSTEKVTPPGATTTPPAPPERIEVSWGKETDAEPGRDFIGVIQKAEYPYKDENAKFEGEQIRFLVKAEDPPYENLQPIWLPPSNKKGTKFIIFRNHIAEQCPQAWRELLPLIQSKQSPYDQMMAYINGMVGMKFRFQDHYHERPNPRPGDKAMRMLCPTEYKGRGSIDEGVVKEEKIQL